MRVAFGCYGVDVGVDLEVALGAEKADVVDHVDFACTLLASDASFKNFRRCVGGAEWETDDRDGQDRSASQRRGDSGDHGRIDADGGCAVLLSFLTDCSDLIEGCIRSKKGVVDESRDLGFGRGKDRGRGDRWKRLERGRQAREERLDARLEAFLCNSRHDLDGSPDDDEVGTRKETMMLV